MKQVQPVVAQAVLLISGNNNPVAVVVGQIYQEEMQLHIHTQQTSHKQPASEDV